MRDVQLPLSPLPPSWAAHRPDVAEGAPVVALAVYARPTEPVGLVGTALGQAVPGVLRVSLGRDIVLQAVAWAQLHTEDGGERPAVGDFLLVTAFAVGGRRRGRAKVMRVLRANPGGMVLADDLDDWAEDRCNSVFGARITEWAVVPDPAAG